MQETNEKLPLCIEFCCIGLSSFPDSASNTYVLNVFLFVAFYFLWKLTRPNWWPSDLIPNGMNWYVDCYVLCRNYRSNSSSYKSKKTTLRTNRRTSRRSTFMHRRKWNESRASRLSLVSSWKPSTRTTALSDQQQVSNKWLCKPVTTWVIITSVTLSDSAVIQIYYLRNSFICWTL